MVDRLAAQIVAANAAQDDCMIAKAARHHGEVRGCSAESGPFRQNIPQQLAYSENQMLSFQGSSPDASVGD
jgi:hypothetical protein